MASAASRANRIFRFGQFELSEGEGELRKNGVRIKLQEQPFQVLVELLANAGKVVTREHLQQKLWPADTFVDFDVGLNTAIRKIRQTLGEDADHPHYIETAAKRGYRFLAPVITATNVVLVEGSAGQPEPLSERVDTRQEGAGCDPARAASGVAVGSGTVAVAQDAAPQSGKQQEVPTSGSVPTLAPPSSASVKAAQLRTAGDRKLWKVLVPTAVLVIALVARFAWFSRPLPPPRVLKTTQITHDGVSKRNLLTDGSRLYITESTAAKEMGIIGTNQFLVQGSVTGGDTSVIPTPFTSVGMFDISPDHSQLLVADQVGTESDTQVLVLPLPTGSPRHLSDVVAHSAVWSPDGRQLAFAKGSDLFLVNADGTNTRKLITVSGFAFSIRFSPDGTRLRFTVWTPQTSSSSIWEVHADGSDFHALLPGWHSPPSECCGAWSADGRYYFFISSLADISNIWALREPSGLFDRRPFDAIPADNRPYVSSFSSA